MKEDGGRGKEREAPTHLNLHAACVTQKEVVEHNCIVCVYVNASEAKTWQNVCVFASFTLQHFR